MTATIAIEPADQPEVASLLALSDQYMAGLYPPEGNFAVDLNALCRPDIALVVARLDGRAVGCGAVKMLDRDSAELKRIFVRDDARGHGLGRRILKALEEVATSRGIHSIYLETGPLNVEAVKLYQAQGYRQCGPFADYEENPYSLFMVKSARADTQLEIVP
ncbi:MAG: GNAT family N-acetyltransferase [Neorhizobium sp.]|nr:GNAT family N-acetyltransferase [Neorhizobium sp.]